MRLAPYAGPWTRVWIFTGPRDRRSFDGARMAAQAATWWKVGIGSGDDLLRYARQAAGRGVGVLRVRGWYRGTDAGRIDRSPVWTRTDCSLPGTRRARVVLETNWYEIIHMKAYAGKYEPSWDLRLGYNRSLLCPLAPEFQQIKARVALAAGAACRDGLSNDRTMTRRFLLRREARPPRGRKPRPTAC